ncbi:hypothetical protein [Candidatus Uabimicrobium amorphum]|uniref:Uncharacterized protein n=1 Tax=Uabimicrobium amorphum TaxID=2596890 RepID=A0A5S9F415_UABAM|nr:hypothetical protein [Candidatus Uabimicrobium amorphum]BBM85327.1 hypothetical protein UABAM_03693 [Candidatus Uabimicrobium amorphum]
MKHFSTFTILIALLFTFAPYAYAGQSKICKKWEKTKKQVEKQFEKYAKDIPLGMNKKSAKKLLKSLGLKYGKYELGDYIKFNKKFITKLDALGVYKTIRVGEVPAKINEVQEDKLASELFSKWCKKEFNYENWKFITEGCEEAPEDIYKNYIDEKAELQVNIQGQLLKRWNDLKDSAFADKAEVKKVIKATKKYCEVNTNDVLARFSASEEIKSKFRFRLLKEKKIKLKNKDEVNVYLSDATTICKGYLNNLAVHRDDLVDGAKKMDDGEQKEDVEELIKQLNILEKRLKKIDKFLDKFKV